MTRKAVRKHAITATQEPGMPDGPSRSSSRMLTVNVDATPTPTRGQHCFCTPLIHWACLSRMR